MSSQDLAGFVVAVTGASTGLGRAIAVGAAVRGAATVIVNYASSAAEAEETVRLVREAGAEALLVQGDVGEDADCRRIVQAAEPFGRIDALFNNAGQTVFAPNYADMDAVTADDFLRIYRTNVVGAYQMIRAAKSLLEAAPQPGAVINTSSIGGVTGQASSVPYAASKAAMINMTLALAKGLAPRIRVNAICPGFIDTPWFERAKPGFDMAKMRAHAAKSTPLQAACTPEEVAESALFFASPQSLRVTGETLLIDAGMHLG